MKEMKFEFYELKLFIIDVVYCFGFYELIDIQKRLIFVVLKKESVIGQLQMGIGKIYVYLLFLLNKIDFVKDVVQVVIMVLIREFVNQIYQEVFKIIQGEEGSQICLKCFIGGIDK